MTTTELPRRVSDIPAIGHTESAGLAETAYARFATALAEVTPHQWALPTDCAGWTVRDLAGHLLGAMRSAASLRELGSQQVAIVRGVRQGLGSQVDVMTQVQIDRTAALTPAELVAQCQSLVRPAALGRRRTPGLVRRARFKADLGHAVERWSLGYLNDVILTRDAWLHLVDLHRALGTTQTLTAEHDGRIVADVVADWARRHGRPFTLTLTGPAGGTYATGGPGGEEITLDAVEFCRILSGRAAGSGLLATPVPF
jgi:uncharacterized protein (TIGR03083 family)